MAEKPAEQLARGGPAAVSAGEGAAPPPSDAVPHPLQGSPCPKRKDRPLAPAEEMETTFMDEPKTSIPVVNGEWISVTLYHYGVNVWICH